MKTANLGVKGVLFILCLALAAGGCDQIAAFFIPPKKTSVKKSAQETAVVSSQSDSPSAAASSAKEPLAAGILAKVGNWSLTIEEFNGRLKVLQEGVPEFNANDVKSKELLLDEIIRQELLVMDAYNQGIDKQKDIANAIEDFKKTLLVQELASRLTKDVAATEAEAQAYYDQNKEMFVEPVTWNVREIVVADEAAAKNILVQLLQGGDFAQIAMAQSKGKTAAQGGALKEFVKAPFEQMQVAIAGLDVGATSSVFKGPEGYYIVKVEGKQGGAAKAFAEIKNELVSGLTLRKQQQTVLEHLNQLAAKTTIQLNKELLK